MCLGATASPTLVFHHVSQLFVHERYVRGHTRYSWAHPLHNRFIVSKFQVLCSFQRMHSRANIAVNISTRLLFDRYLVLDQQMYFQLLIACKAYYGHCVVLNKRLENFHMYQSKMVLVFAGVLFIILKTICYNLPSHKY